LAVFRLRARKCREEKPFAVIFPSLDAIATSCRIRINDAVTREAIELFEPDVIIASFLKRALAADEVWACKNIDLNPHYKDMGNLYGSEYWA
jgi:hypothetical protein